IKEAVGVLAAAGLLEIEPAAALRNTAVEPIVDDIGRDAAELDGAAAPAADKLAARGGMGFRPVRGFDPRRIAGAAAGMGLGEALLLGLAQAGETLLVELRGDVLPAGRGGGG